MDKIFICSEQQHNKFWGYKIAGNNVVCKWGRVGSTEKEKSFSFPSRYSLDSYLDSKIAEKEKKGYKEVSKEKLKEESEISQSLGIQNKIKKLLFVSKKGSSLTQINDYDPNQYVYVEILNSWKKDITRLLLSRTESFKILNGISEDTQRRKLTFNNNDLVAINGDRDFVAAVRSILMKMSQVVAEIMRTVKIGAVGVRNLFDDDNNVTQPDLQEAFTHIDTSGFDSSVIRKFASMGNRSLEL